MPLLLQEKLELRHHQCRTVKNAELLALAAFQATMGFRKRGEFDKKLKVRVKEAENYVKSINNRGYFPRLIRVSTIDQVSFRYLLM